MRFLIALVLSSTLLASSARACDFHSWSSGPGGTLYRAQLDSDHNLTLSKVNFSASYSEQLNLFPNSNCEVRWVSIVGAVMVGLGNAAVGPGTGLNVTPAVGLGFYNSFVRVLAGYDALNLAATSTGLFLGKLNAQNFALYVGVGLNFDLAAIMPVDTLGVPLAPKAEPFGWVRP
jgi:hypothetical protein